MFHVAGYHDHFHCGFIRPLANTITNTNTEPGNILLLTLALSLTLIL